MKIIHYCKLFSPVSQTFIYDVIVQLNKLGESNIVLTNKIVNQIDRPLSDVYELPSFEESLFERVFRKLLFKIGFAKYDWQIVHDNFIRRNIAALLRIHKPDVIHAHFGPQGYLIQPVANMLGIPLVVSFHGFDAYRLPKEQGGVEQLLTIFQSATMVTVVSQVMKMQLIKLGCHLDKIVVIHVGKKIEDYTFKSSFSKNITRFLSIGRLSEKKGHDDAIKAFARLSAKIPDLHFDIIGDGELKESLNILIQDLQLSEKVKLLGSLNHEETKKKLFNSDVFILCSKTAKDGDQEGIPTVLMEAQAIGLPCISTFHSGIPEVIPLENAWMLAEEGDVEAIAKNMENLIYATNEILNTSALLGRIKINDEFNLVIEVQKIRTLYKSMILDRKNENINN
jgi:colanic acid/amylovoran biosynthesis glycosyltransferase